MPIKVMCPGCKKTLSIPSKYFGKVVACPNCRAELSIPLPSEAPRKAKPDVTSTASSPAPPVVSPPLQGLPPKPAHSSSAERSNAQNKACQYCGEEILSTAKKCKHCGEFLDPILRDQQRIDSQISKSMNSQVSNPGVPAVLSLIIPGAGQMYKGQVGGGVVWLICVTLGYIAFILPGLILHIVCIVDAASSNQSRFD